MVAHGQSRLVGWFRGHHRCLVALCLLLFSILSPAAEPLRVPSGLDGKALGRHMDLLRDPAGRLSIQDVSHGAASGRFMPSTWDCPNFGYTSDTVWIRLPLSNEQNRPVSFLLEMGYPQLDRIELFMQKDGEWIQRVLGDHQPFNQREVKYRTFVFPVQLAAGEQATCFLRVQSTSSMSLALAAWDQQAFLGNASNELILIGTFFGIVLAMSLFNIMVFLFTRDRGYLYQVLVNIHAMLFYLIMSGLAFQFLWPKQVWWANYSLLFVIAFSNFWMFQFTRSFLSLGASAPRQDRVLRFVQWSAALLTVLIPVLSYGVNVRVFLGITFITVVSILMVGIASLIRGNRAARIFMLAWVGLIFGNAILTLKTVGILPDTFFTRHSAFLGLALLALLISLALLDRMHLMKKDLEKLNVGLDRLVTERTRELNDKNSELMVVNEQKNQYLGIVAHDLRSPLSGIVLAAELIDGEEDLAEAQSIAKKIKAEGMEMADLIGRLLDYAAIEAGKVKAEPADFALAEVSQHIVNRHVKGAKRKGISIATPPFEGSSLVHADIKFTKEILNNLISNAIKFSPAEKAISVSLQDQGDWMRVSVGDQGPGLTEDDKKKLFSRFSKLSAKPTAGEKSVGLGLSIVKQMVDLMGGRIWVESDFGRGATFHLELPKAGLASE